MLRRVLSNALMVLGMLIAQHVGASQNYVIAQGYFEDSTNALTFEQIRSKEFVQYEKILARGYSHSTYWLRLKIKSDSSDGPLVLRIRPVYTDEVELFDSLERPQDLKPRLTGDKYSWSNDEYQSLNLNFKLKKALVDRDIYLRVKSAHTYMLHVEALDQKTVEVSDKKLDITYILYLSFLFILFILFIWLGTSWALSRDPVLWLFSLTQLLAVFYAAGMSGFTRVFFDQIVSPESINSITNYLIVGYVCVALSAHYKLLSEHGLKKGLKKILLLFTLVPILSGLLMLLDHPMIGLRLNATSLLVATFFLALITFVGISPDVSKREKLLLPLWLLRGYYWLLLFILLLSLLPMMGAIPAVQFTLHALFLHGLFSGLLLFFVLQYRIKKINQYQIEKIAVESSKASQERLRREDQSRLVGMLTHELKNSLAVVDLAASLIREKSKDDSPVIDKNLGNISRAIDDINLVIARCIDVDKLDQEKIQVFNRTINLSEYLRNLSREMKDLKRLEWDLNSEILIEADPDLLKVVLVNLIDNADKYASADSLIHVRTDVHSNDTSIVVTNRVGDSGFPDEGRLFDKYYRAEKAQKDRGTGLGLWLSRSIAHLIGADLVYKTANDLIVFSIVWKHAKK